MSIISETGNKYYIYITPEEGAISWNINTYEQNQCGFVAYFGKILQAVEKNLTSGGWTFYVTMMCMDELPSYGEKVIVLIYGDELCRIPKYANKVGAIFKCYGTNQALGCNPITQPSYLNLMTTVQYIRNYLIRLPRILNHQSNKFFNKIKSILGQDNQKMAPIYDIPLGYYNSQDMPIKNFDERSFDVYFAGSSSHTQYPLWSLKYWLRTPKTISRENMLDNLKKFKQKYPEFNIESSVTSAFGAKGASDAATQYCEKMMNTKICLAPRGTSLETYRFYEAIKYGCIVITEALPSRWFYDGSPAIQVEDWRQLEEVLTQLLQNKTLLNETHEKSLHWWETKCSESVVGKYIAENLNSM
ncbi:hypothetical protein NIES2101_20430 [Calothrix sp. HK-06]|nr:hypothetical protein NIES2101_20430 [Calothrix sp. HK-06]